MNILREVRRVNEKSMATRIILLLLFSVIFLVNTYAWFSASKDVSITGVTGDVTSWDIAYYVNSDDEYAGAMINETLTFTVEDLYPGMPEREDVVNIYNIGKASTKIKYELISVKVFGQEVWKQGAENSELQIQTTGNTTTIFAGDTSADEDGKKEDGTNAYPFNISFTYDKDKLIGKYEEGGDYESSAHAAMKFNVSWTYEQGDTETEIEAKDILDTKFGKDAYAYYQDSSKDPSKAIEIQVKITSSMIHPSNDPDYPYGEN